jgi:hypothetical protein
MTNTETAPVARTIEAIDQGLIDLHQDLWASEKAAHELFMVHRDAMLAGVRGATMHLRFGRIERAAEILDAMREDFARFGF